MDGESHDAGCALRLRVRQLELRLQEANHRVANSLQLVSSLTEHEARATDDPIARSRFVSTRHHIQAVAQVHRLLSVDVDAEQIALDDYLADVASGLQGAVDGGGRTRFVTARCDPWFVTPEIAVCFGMIVNELVSNACKYAYPGHALGEVRVLFRDHGALGFTLVVEDDGLGLDSSREARGGGVGTRMVTAMAQRLGAAFRFEASVFGARGVVTTLPLPDHAGRPAPVAACPTPVNDITPGAQT